MAKNQELDVDPSFGLRSPLIDLQDLKRKSMRGGAVTILSQGVNVAVQLTSTIILARLLTADDYGVIAMVLAVTSFAALFRDLGLSAAAIQKGVLDHCQMTNLFWLNVAMGLSLTCIVSACAPLVAWFYDKPELTSLTVLLSFTFIIGSLGTQHGALLQRELRFGRLATSVVAGSIVNLAISIILALSNWGYWSLAWGTICGNIATTILLFVLSSFRPGYLRKTADVRSMLKYGAHVTGFDFVNYFHRNLDNILIGKFCGADALGLYSRAYQLLMFPVNNMRGPINAVVFPAMCRLLNQPEAYRVYYRRAIGILALISMPFTAFIFVASDPIIELALGREWLGASTIYSLLAITAFIQPVASMRGVVLLSSGHSKVYLKWGIFNAISVSIGFLCGIPWGTKGVAVAYAVVTYLILYPSLVMTFKNTALRISDFFKPILLPAFASVIAAVFCIFIVSTIPDKRDTSPLMLLIIQGGLLFGVYGFICATLPQGRREMRLVYEFLSAICKRNSSI